MTQDTSSPQYLDLKKELRSLLISSQQGCTEQQLLKDYAQYVSRKEIPYREMGYRTLMDLLRSMPDAARIDQNRMPSIIHGVADSTTIHLQNLVRGQTNKKKPRNVRGPTNTSFYRTNGSSTYARNRPPPNYYGSNSIPFQPYNQILNVNRISSGTFDTQNVPTLPLYTTISYSSTSMTNNAVQDSHRQTPNGIYQTSTAKTVASFPPKSTPTPTPRAEAMSVQATPIIDDNSSVMDDDLNYSDDEELAANDAQHGENIVFLRKRIRQLLLEYPHGLWLSSVSKLYKKLYKEDLSLEEFQLKNLMALFDCVSDFVDCQRDPLGNTSERILLLKKNFTEATKREQQTQGNIESTTSLSSVRDNQNTMRTDQDSLRLLTSDIDRPIVDLSSFAPLNFHYKRIEHTSNVPFEGFLGDVEDPWSIRIGNVQFIPKREQMMTRLQDHYNQASDQSIYVIPFEQLEIDLTCVYYHHTDHHYYRSYIMQIDRLYNPNIVILKIYLVDYGRIISDISYHISSTSLKFLHQNFSSLATQVYDCRLVNIHYPARFVRWSDDAQQFIVDLCQGINFSVEIIGFLDSSYCIYLWMDSNQRQSINQLLIQRNLAIEFDDSRNPAFRPISSNTQSNVSSNNYIDERLLSRHEQTNIEYNSEENNFKHFIISIEHAYYLVKHPFTKRPCLPCFEVARLLNEDEIFVSELNLIRETELPLSESHRTLFNDLRGLTESSRCLHINRDDTNATIKFYDLSSIRDYLCKIKFREGDVIDAFRHEYDDYERPGYWNEKKNSYISKDNLESQQESLYQRRDLLNFRREQLVSLSQNHHNSSSHNDIEEIERNLNNLNQDIHSMETILPSTRDDPEHSIPRLSSSNHKMRDTLFRIARPFDQQFSLNVRFNHQSLDNQLLCDADDGDIEERFQDLYRITKNVIQFFTLESDISDAKQRDLLKEANAILPDLVDKNILWNRRIDIYNYCLQIVEYFQPTIRCYAHHTDSLDLIY